MTIAAITIVAIAATVVVKNAAGGNSGKTKIAATNVINVMIAVINQQTLHFSIFNTYLGGQNSFCPFFF